MNFRSPIIFIIVIVAVLITIGWAYFDNRAKEKKEKEAAASVEQPKVSNLSNIDPTEFDSVVKREYALATEKATAVQADYKLSAIEVEIGKDLLPEQVNTRYIFSGPSDEKNNWMITISQASGNYIRAAIPKEDYLGTLSEINTKLWKFNSITAFQLAEQNGGLAWREKNELQGIKLSLKHAGEKNWLLWIIEYQGKSGNLTIKLDASSGKVVTE